MRMTVLIAWDLAYCGCSVNLYFSCYIDNKNIFDRASR